MGFWRYRPRGTVHLGHWLASEQERSLQEQIVRLQSLLAAARRENARLRKGGKAKDGRRRAPDETQAAGRYPIAREGTGYQGRDGTIYYPERAARRAQPQMVQQHASAGYNPRRMKPENLEDRLIRAARAVPPDKRETAICCLEQLAAGEVTAPAPEPPRPVPAAAPPSSALAWPSEKWKGSPEELSGKRFQILAFLRRVWKPFIEDNKVLVTQEILKAHDTAAAKAVDNTLRYHPLPSDIPIITHDELRRHLRRRPVSVDSLAALHA